MEVTIGVSWVDSPLGHNEGVTIMRFHQWSEMTLRDRQWGVPSGVPHINWGMGNWQSGLEPSPQHQAECKDRSGSVWVWLCVSSLVVVSNSWGRDDSSPRLCSPGVSVLRKLTSVLLFVCHIGHPSLALHSLRVGGKGKGGYPIGCPDLFPGHRQSPDTHYGVCLTDVFEKVWTLRYLVPRVPSSFFISRLSALYAKNTLFFTNFEMD